MNPEDQAAQMEGMAPEGEMPEAAFPEDSLGPETPPENGPEYQQLVDYCMKLYDSFEKSDYREKTLKIITESRRAYEMISDPSKEMWDGASNEVLPLLAITIDNLEPRLVAGLVGREPICKMEMEGMSQVDAPTQQIEHWFNTELKEKVFVETKAMSVVHTLLLEGTFYCAPQYDTESVKQKDFAYDQQGQIIIGTGQPLPKPDGTAIETEQGKPVTIETEKTIFEGGKIENIPFNDILCPDDIGTLEVWEKCDKIRCTRPTYSELMQRKDGTGYMADRIGKWLFHEKGETKIADDDRSPGQKVAGVGVHGKEVIESLEFYITYPIYKNEEEQWEEQTDFREERLLVTIAKATKRIYRICYLKDLNFKNESIIKRVRLFPEEGRSFGTPMFGKLKGTQNGASDLFNALLNIAYVVMIPSGFYEESAGLRGKVDLQPGQWQKCDNIKGILPFAYNINPANYLNFMETFFTLWERSGSISNPQMGRPDDQKKTATEIMMVVQEGNAKFDYQSKTTRDEFLAILKTLYDLYYQYLPYKPVEFIYNGKPVVLPRQLMRRGYKFSLTGSTAAANKMIERKEAEELNGLASQNPLMNPMSTLEELLKAYGKTDTQRYINPEVQQILKVFAENPELKQVVGKYIQTKQQISQEVKGGGNV